MKQLPVLIIGAGPTGLMMACELARHGVSFRIIDKKSTPEPGSNATWIQTRTLEIFDAIGLIHPFLEIGNKCEAINFYVKGKLLGNLSVNKIDSAYPYILMAPQNKTELFLTKRLSEFKIQIERSIELIDIKQTKNGVTSVVKTSNGKTETILSKWVVACDGANSTVRDKCQIRFPGKDIPEQFMVADGKMSSFLSTEEIHVFFDKGDIFPDKGTVFSAFPWGPNEYRLNANLYLSHPRQSFTEREIKELVAERTYGNYIVDSVSWISPFWIHSKIVNSMRVGSIFLAGDAAHIHSPAGGQGMNSGLQDAFNLAWKLALVAKRKAKPSLLESYQLERFPVVKEIVKQTEYFTNMFLYDKSFSNKLQKFCKNVCKNSRLIKKMNAQLSQINITYKKSPVIHYKEKPTAKAPRQGERAPDVMIDDSKNLNSYFHNTLHNILIFVDDTLTKSQQEKINKLEKLINKKFKTLVKVFLVSKKPSHSRGDMNGMGRGNSMILDKNNSIHKRYHAKPLSIYMIRPDGYISYYSKKLNLLSLEKYLHNYFSN